MTRKVTDSFEESTQKGGGKTAFLVILLVAIIGFCWYYVLQAKKEYKNAEPVVGTITITIPQPINNLPLEAEKKSLEEPQVKSPTVLETRVVSTAAQQQEETTPYTVKSGDTLGKIAGKEWKRVCELNKLADCNRLVPGQKLVLSEDSASEARGVTSAAPRPVVAKAKPAPVGRPVVQTASSEFVWRVVGGSPLKNCGRKVVATINEEAWVAMGLTAEEREELRALVALSGNEPRITSESAVWLGPGMKFPAVTFCKEGKAVARTNVLTAWPSNQGVFGERFVLSTGKRLIWVRNCHNWLVDTPAPIEPQRQPGPPPPSLQEPAPAQPIEPEPLKPLSAIPVYGEELWELKGKIKYEGIAGAWIGQTGGLSKWHGHYAEGLLLYELDNGYEMGVGLYGMRGYGKSKLSPYSWREGNGWGPQIALKRNYEKEQKDEFGQILLLPAGWGLKFRAVEDWARGGNPVSGYHQEQTGRKLGLYADYYEQRGYDWIYGGSFEAWWSYDRHIQSTWAGDKPQDRGSVALDLYAQYRFNDTWQGRMIAGLSRQNWDRLVYLNLAAEARWQETIMCGPRVSLALDKGIHVDVPRSDLHALMGFCRVELGDTIRVHMRETEEGTVQFIGPASAKR